MEDRTIKFLLSGILLCLLIIAFRSGKPPVVNNIPSSGGQTLYLQDNNNANKVIPLSENKIAVVITERGNFDFGLIKVFEFNKEKAMYTLIGQFKPTDPLTYDVLPSK